MRQLSILSVALLWGCGGSAYSYSEESSGGGGDTLAVATESYGGEEDYAMPGAPPAPMEPTADMEMSLASGSSTGGADFDSWDQWESEPEPEPRAEAAAPPARQIAQANTTGETTPTAGQGQQQPQQQQATDAVDLSQPLLIYTAQLHLGVYEVEATQEAILGIIREVEGFLAQRTSNQLVVRVPAAQFHRVLDQIEETGDVLNRNVEVLDVSEEYRDLAIRIRNAEAMRDRLEQLLRNANNVQEALAVERELQRITEMIERMKGRLRFLSDRIAFSTITIHFRPLTQGETIEQDPFRLPFQWLDTLGLSTLLSL